MPLNDPLPSSAADVIDYNVRRLDEFVTSDALTYEDRLGGVRRTIAGINAVFDSTQAGEFVAASEAAQLAAEIAAQQALAAGRIYETSAAGQADVELVDGDYFSVVSADDNTVYELWRKGAVTPTDTGKRSPNITAIQDLEQSLLSPASLVFGSNSDMSAENNFVATVGSPTFDVNTTVVGELYVDFSTPSTNYAIGIAGILDGSTSYWCEVDITVLSGTAGVLQFGRHSSTPSTTSTFITIPNGGKRTYKGLFSTPSGSTTFNFGVAAAGNLTGFTFSIDNLRVYKLTEQQTIEYREYLQAYESQTQYEFISGTDSDMSGENGWRGLVGSPVFDVNTTDSGKLFFDVSGAQANANKAIGLYANLAKDQRYKVSIDARLVSGTSAPFRLGGFASTLPVPSDALGFTPTSTEQTFEGYITPTTDNFILYLGVIRTANPTGGTYTFDNIKVQAISNKEYEQDLALAQLEPLIGLDVTVSNISETLDMTNRLTGANSDMSASNDWLAEIGTPVFDVNSTVTGKLHFDVSGAQAATHKAIKVAVGLEIGKKYEIKIKARLASGTACQWRFGQYASASINDAVLGFSPTSTETEFSKIITSAITGDIFLGVLGTENPTGGTYEFDDVVVTPLNAKDVEQDARLDLLESSGVVPTANSFFTEQFLQSLSRFDKPLTKIAVAGDSLMANAYGGAPPDNEGSGRWPMRLDVNTIPRRIYDLLSWNKAEHRRLDDIDWTLSGAWTTVNDNSVWVGFHSQELYHTSVDPSAYAEITIPDGIENFALIGHRRNNMGAVDVTLNGGSIAVYGPSEIDFQRDSTHTNETGSPYYTIEYLGLPSGANTIRISKKADADEVRIWGGFYWSGNTMMLYVVAQGGHTMQDLISQGHFVYDVVENNMDAILFETTVMNEASEPRTVDQSKEDLQFIIDNYMDGKDYMLMNPFPFGDNGSGTNFYTLYSDPTMEETCNGLREIAYANSAPFVNVFDIWKKKIENRGGTLLGGETGLWYTTDGQHPNTDGAREWFNVIRFALESKPIRYS